MAAMAPSPEQVQEVYSLFVKDNDNSLATKDLGTALRALGMDMSEAQLQDAVGKLDAEGSDTIDYSTFQSVVTGALEDGAFDEKEEPPAKKIKPADAPGDAVGDAVAVDGTGGAALKSQSSSSLVAALGAALDAAKLPNKLLELALGYCEVNGAADAKELLEDFDDFAAALQLKKLESRRLYKALEQIAAPFSAPMSNTHVPGANVECDSAPLTGTLAASHPKDAVAVSGNGAVPSVNE